MSIRLNDQELNKEKERQKKKAKLIFNTLKKGKVKVDLYDPDNLNPEIVFQYQIHNAHFKSMVDYTDGSVRSIVVCFYDDVDISNQDGSEIRENLPMWLVSGIEMELIKKFDAFNVELSMRESDEGKKTIVNEDVSEHQKMINKVRVIYKAYRKGKMNFSYGETEHSKKTVNWTLPSKISVKIKKYDERENQYGNEDYPILKLDTETINYITSTGKPVSNGEKMVISSKIASLFKKYGIVVYWSGGGNLINTDYTHIDISPK